MECMESFVASLLVWLALPKVGLPALFMVSLISATLLPMGSEPALFAYIKLNPEMFWPALLVASAGNTAGGMISWWMGYGARVALIRMRSRRGPVWRRQTRDETPHRFNPRLLKWFDKLGPPALLFSWLPVVGDPLCAVAGWLRLPWRQCLLYMAVGKTLRYLVMTLFLLGIPNTVWHDLFGPLLHLLKVE